MYDAAVIGGGLAGCSAAIMLARRGQQVALLEAGTYPRPKVCGEFLSPESGAVFEALGFTERLRGLKPATIRTVRITAADGVEWRSAFPAPALGVSRYALDAALAEFAAAAGVEVIQGAAVRDISGSLADGFRLEIRGREDVEARGVIAAHGKRSGLDRALGRRQDGGFVGLKRHYRGPALPGHIDLHVFGGGYCGMSQVEDGATNVCLLVRQDVFAEAAGRGSDAVERFVGWMRGQNAALGRWLAQAVPVYDDWLSIAGVSVAAKRPVGDDVLMAGDSAGMVAPLAGDGMAMALHGGMLAAACLDGFLCDRAGADETKQTYTRLWRRTFAARLRLGRGLQAVMLRPALLSPGLRLMNAWPALGDWLVRSTRDLRLLEKTT